LILFRFSHEKCHHINGQWEHNRRIFLCRNGVQCLNFVFKNRNKKRQGGFLIRDFANKIFITSIYLKISELQSSWRVANNFWSLPQSTWCFLFTLRCNNFSSCLSWRFSLAKMDNRDNFKDCKFYFKYFIEWKPIILKHLLLQPSLSAIEQAISRPY
jgi:hypothetical protein